MNILLLGSGGREHALAYKISQSPLCDQLYIAPGNPGTEKHGQNVAISISDFEAIGKFVLENNIDMIVPGPEDPLVKGIVNYFDESETLPPVHIIGPTREGAMLEGSKSFAKAFMQQHRIPTAAYAVFDSENISEALTYIDSHSTPLVLKADGLAGGKGVVICATREEAKNELQAMIAGKFGTAGSKVVVEEFLTGREMSVFILTDGANYKVLPAAKDYKRAGEGDTGLNTGGMGAIAPVPFAGADLMKRVEEEIIIPTIDGLQQDKITYKGFLYFGLMIVNEKPYMIEYNCRMGDPEAEAVMPLLKSDLVQLFLGVSTESLDQKEMELLPYTSATVVLASKGYPGEYETGKIVHNLTQTSGCLVFHAGTRQRVNGDIETSGGRVIAITALSRKLSEAIETAEHNAGIINFEGKYFRKDIGKDVL